MKEIYNYMKRRAIPIILVLMISFILAGIPLLTITFNPPTPADGATSNQSLEINATIDGGVSQIIYNWDGTNFTLFNNSLVMMFNLDNLSALGENNNYVVDASGHGHDGIVSGATWNTNGKYNGAFEFDGVNDYIEINAAASLDFGSPITYDLWVNLKNYSKGGPAKTDEFAALIYQASVASQFHRGIWVDPNGTVYLQPGGAQIRYNETNTIIPLNTWTHVAVKYYNSSINETTTELYLNGNLRNSYTDNFTMWADGGAYYIGRDNYGRYLNGSIDEVKVWKEALTASEINQSYMTNLRKIDTNKWELYVNQTKSPNVPLDNGTYSFGIYAIDYWGNLVSSGDIQVTFVNGPSLTDTTPPTITIHSPLAQDYNTTTINLDVTADETISEWIYDNGTANYTFTPNTTLIFSEGLNTLTIYANDTSNNWDQESVTFFVDTISPTWENNKTNASSSTLENEVIYFNITLNDSVAGGNYMFNFSLDNGTTWTETIGNWTNGEEIEIIKLINASAGSIVKWNWWFNDSVGNQNTSDTWNLTVASIPIILTPVSEGGSGGGSGGGTLTYWRCSTWGEWSACQNDEQSRTCSLKQPVSFDERESLTQTQDCKVVEQTNTNTPEGTNSGTTGFVSGITGAVTGFAGTGRGIATLVFIALVLLSVAGIIIYRTWFLGKTKIKK